MRTGKLRFFLLISVYSFFIAFLNGCGSGQGTATPTGTAPSAPTGVTVTAGNKQVSISWTAVSDATSYNIYWSTTSGVTKTTGTKVTSNTNSYIHPSLTNGTTYYYVVTAVDNDGESTESSEVNAMPASTNWASVSAGALHTIAIKRDDTLYTLWAWGYNASGRLGDGTTTNRTTPTQIGTATTWSSVFSGEHHTAAIKTNGTLWAWGRNNSGQLGDGTIISKTTPTQIGAETTWSSVSGGGWHTVARKSDGTLWAWGYNDDGQLGDGTIISKTTPTQIGAETTWSSVSGGGWHTVARKSDGTLWAWGDNYYGQLGDGTTTDRTTPTKIP